MWGRQGYLGKMALKSELPPCLGAWEALSCSESGKALGPEYQMVRQQAAAEALEEADLVIWGGAGPAGQVGGSWSEIRTGPNTKTFQGALW